MDDLISISAEGETTLDSGLLNKTLNLFAEGGNFNNNLSSFIKWLSNTYYPHLIVFIPHVSANLSEYFTSQTVIYGTDVSDLDNAKLENIIVQFMEGASNIKQLVSHDISNPKDRKLVKDLGVTSVFIIPVIAKNKNLGCLAFLEDEVPRLWSKKETSDIVMLSRVFSQFLYSETVDKELFTKEDILQKAIESSNDGYWHIDLKQNQMHFSRQWKRMLGFDENELSDSFETFENLLHPDDKEIVLHVLDPYLKLGMGSYECEYRIRNKKGIYIWVLTRANVNFSDNGIPLQFVATNTDITSRIEYKRKLAKSEAKYEKLLGSIHEIIFEIDRKGIVTFLNSAWERHLLFKVNKTIGTLYTKYIHPEDRPIVLDVIAIPYSGTELVHVTREVRLLAANGKSVWMEIHFSLRYTDNKLLDEVKGTLVNVAERKNVELEKAASENKLARISENISDLIIEIDESGRYLFMSNAVRQMIGRNPNEFLGKMAIDDVHPEELDQINRNIFQQLLNGANRVVEQYRFKAVDDDYIWVEAIVQPLISVSGKRTFIAALRDISARRKAEDDMKVALAKEKDLNELKSRFITMTSHEFRTPLSSIQSSVELLEMYAEDLGDRFMKPFDKHFNKITTQVSRINNLLHNIDTLGKIEAMEMPFSPVSQNLVEFTNNIIQQQVLGEFPEREIELKITGAEEPRLFDPALLDNLMYNVFKNALLYSQNKVSCELKFEKSHFCIEISDTGIGIPEEDMAHLFTTFFRAKNIVNLNIPGNGLGLIISRKIASIHSGTIELESVEKQGTTVKVKIPLKFN
ncbi:MAG: PAS domain S-box-containing protein [Salibacteraceae bacterium]|jgi:PAS domain S-box-containing protein